MPIMKKRLLVIPFMLAWSFASANSWLPELPMNIYGNINLWSSEINWWILDIYAGNNKLASFDIVSGKYGSNKATEEHLILNEFDWNLTFKVRYNWETYDVNSIDDTNKSDWCPNKDNITFVSKDCRYDITLKEIVKQEEKTVTKSYSWSWWHRNTIVKEEPKKEKVSWYNEWNQYEILSNWYSREFNNAYTFAYMNWITTMPSIQQADMNWSLTRIAMAKMLSQYAINVLWKKPDTTKIPAFDDVSIELDYKYNNWVSLAYQLWIMWVWIKSFRPYDLVTRAEFGTALSRLLYNTQNGRDIYYTPHLNKLMNMWIITNVDPDLQETRWYVMLMLMRSAKNFIS